MISFFVLGFDSVIHHKVGYLGFWTCLPFPPSLSIIYLGFFSFFFFKDGLWSLLPSSEAGLFFVCLGVLLPWVSSLFVKTSRENHSWSFYIVTILSMSWN